jgi:hypothetical protein
LEPGRLLATESDGVQLSAGILSVSQPENKAVVRVMVEAVPARIIKLLKPGIEITDNRSQNAAGKIRRVLDIDRSETPEPLSYSSNGNFGGNYRRVLLDLELNITTNQGNPLFLGQQVNFGRNLNLGILGKSLTGTIVYNSELPERMTRSLETIQVEFTNVSPELVAWIRVGEREYNQYGPSTWKIVRIISNQPGKLLYPSSDGSKAMYANHPELRVIRCLMELDVFKSDNDLYYKGTMLKIGTPIPFSAKRWTHSATVVAF